MASAPESKEIRIVRVFDAPRDLVWQAWTQAEHIAAWWGPEDFQATSVESDPRPGGVLRIVMRGPDGSEHATAGVYREIVDRERIVVASTILDPDGSPVLESSHTVELAEAGTGTAVTVTARAVALVPEAVAMLGGMQAGWNQSLQCLDDVFTGAVDRQIVLSRNLQAPRERVFELWTRAEHLSRWWGPRGFPLTTHAMDVRPGGAWRFTMHGPDGPGYPNEIVYDEIRSPERLVYTHTDPKFRTTVTFDEMMGMTALTMRMVFPSAGERDTVAERYGAAEGAAQTLGRLGDLVRISA